MVRMRKEFKAKLFDLPILGNKLFRPYIIKKEHGEQESETLRYYVKKKYHVSVGLYSYGGCLKQEFNLGGSVEIGRYCSFASNIHYFGTNHPMNYASMSPYFFNPHFGKKVRDVSRETLSVGHDVWCGYGVMLTSKCKNIGNGAVIAAGSIVTKDVPPYAIVSGAPARIQRYRFKKETIQLLEQSRWWELSPDELMEYYDVIDRPEIFARKIITREQNTVQKYEKGSLLQKYKSIPVPMKAGIWFVVCSTLQKCIGLITTPIFTRIMTTLEYGQFSIYHSWLSIFSIITTLRLDFTVFSKGMSVYKKERDGYIASMQMVTSLLTFVFFLIYLCFRSQVNHLTELGTAITFLMLVELFVKPAYSFWILKERYEYRYQKTVLITTLSTIVTSAVGVLAVITAPQDKKVISLILSNVVVQVALGVVLYILNFYHGFKTAKKEHAVFALKFNLPLFPHYMSIYILNQMDRIMIQKMVGVAEAGIYSITYNIGMTMQIITTNIMNALTPWYYEKLENEKFVEIKKIFVPIMVLCCLPVFLFIAFAPEAMRLLVAKTYYEAVYIIPPVSVSVVFLAMYSFFCIPEFYYDANKFSMYVSMAGAALNVGLNFIFIRLFGYMAAGYTTLVCYMLFAVCHFFYSEHVIKKKKNVSLFRMSTVLLFITVNMGYAVLMTILYTNNILRYMVIGVIIVLVFILRNYIRNAVEIMRKK